MVELHPHAMAHGGEAVARRDGKAHFVAGAMPGEVVEASIVEDKGSWARAVLIEVVAPSDARRTPPCPHAEACGGCQWQFADEATQRAWKRDTVISQLEHLGRIEDPVVHDIVAAGPSLGYRNRMDFHVVNGAPGLMRARSNDVEPLSVCLLIDPLLRPVWDSLGPLDGVSRLTLRCGTNTGDLVAIVDGEVPEQADAWGVQVVQRRGKKLEAAGGRAQLTEIVGGTTFEIPVDGFFQNNTHGAEALVDLARASAELEAHETLLDGYCGVGLFGATVGTDAGFVVGIDSSRRAVEFARRNLDAAGVDANVVAGSFTKDIESLDAYWDVAVVDPPRKGLTERGVEAVTSAMPRRIVYVSCDPASLARDARTLATHGYDFIEATPVDMFPQTFHVEVVATFDRQPLGD